MKTARYWAEKYSHCMCGETIIEEIQQDAYASRYAEGIKKAAERLEELGSMPLANRIRNLLPE